MGNMVVGINWNSLWCALNGYEQGALNKMWFIRRNNHGGH